MKKFLYVLNPYKRKCKCLINKQESTELQHSNVYQKKIDRI